ncbi:MAG: alpha/beta hydrolase [Halanaerobiales bacterium]|nr:alpha/beta hydrolase [Halanaerobiales bacterium]
MVYSKKVLNYQNMKLALHKWEPENDINGLIQIIHGAAEHQKRYKKMAEFFTDKGFLVFGIDNLGHGQTHLLNDSTLGYFGTEQGWIKVVNSNKYAAKVIKEKHSDKKLFIMGHSMGSIIARYYLIGENITDGIILTGIMCYKKFLMAILKLIADFEKLLKYENSENEINSFLQELIFNYKFNRSIKHSWICGVKEEVKNYNQDNFCGFKYSNQMYTDLLTGLKDIEKIEKNKKISNNVPIFIISGNQDPVSDNGKNVKKLFEIYKDCNLDDLKYKIYNGVRHEVMRDIRKEEFLFDLKEWINKHNI